MSLVFLLWLIGIFWLSIWAIAAHRNPEKYLEKFPFGMRSGEDVARQHGTGMPF